MKFNESTSIAKIDEYLREFGLTLVQGYDDRISVYKETMHGWICQHDFYSKTQLTIFVNNLQGN